MFCTNASQTLLSQHKVGSAAAETNFTNSNNKLLTLLKEEVIPVCAVCSSLKNQLWDKYMSACRLIFNLSGWIKSVMAFWHVMSLCFTKNTNRTEKGAATKYWLKGVIT